MRFLRPAAALWLAAALHAEDPEGRINVTLDSTGSARVELAADAAANEESVRAFFERQTACRPGSIHIGSKRTTVHLDCSAWVQPENGKLRATIDADPLHRWFYALDVHDVTILVNVPEAGGNPRRLEGWSLIQPSGEGLFYGARSVPGSVLPAPLTVTYAGSALASPGQGGSGAAPLLVFLAVTFGPVLIAAPLSMMALQALARDPETAIGGPRIWVHLLVTTLWLVWIGLAGMLNCASVAWQVAPTPWLATPLALALAALPPLLGSLNALALWQSVEQKAGTDFGAGFWRPVWGAAALQAQGILPMVLIHTALRLSEFSTAAGIAAGMAGLLSLAAPLAAGTPGCRWGEIPAGPLADRIREMAASADVKLRQALLVPAGGLEGPNAYALGPGRIAITEELVQRLPRPELDTILAHELGHVKHADHRIRFWSWLAYVLLQPIAWIALARALPASLNLLVLPAQVFLFNALLGALYRRAEHRADVFAARLTGDPEAAIRALSRLHLLLRMPRRWDAVTGQLSTHPDLDSRIAAIAESIHRPEEWARNISERPLPAAGDVYVIDSAPAEAAA